MTAYRKTRDTIADRMNWQEIGALSDRDLERATAKSLGWKFVYKGKQVLLYAPDGSLECDQCPASTIVETHIPHYLDELPFDLVEAKVVALGLAQHIEIYPFGRAVHVSMETLRKVGNGEDHTEGKAIIYLYRRAYLRAFVHWCLQ